MTRITLRPHLLVWAIILALVTAAGPIAEAPATGASVTHHKAKKQTAKKHPKRKEHPQAYTGSLKKGKGRQRTVRVPLAGKGGVVDPGDDYPANLKNRAQDSVFDQWRMYNRECTSFVAWALASRNGFNIPFWANANQWGPMAAARGFAVNGTPAPGSVAWSRAGTYGHVAYVQGVVGDKVYIQEYNRTGRGTYSSRTVPANSFSGYIHFADRQVDVPAAPAPTPTPTPTPAPATSAAPTADPTTTAPATGTTPATTPAPTPAPAPRTYTETTGGNTNTWTNYGNAGGSQGPTIPSNSSVQIACKVTGFRVADGNTWWYRIAQSPWNGTFYASADAFYNNGQTSGPLRGTPFVDGAVPDC